MCHKGCSLHWATFTRVLVCLGLLLLTLGCDFGTDRDRKNRETGPVDVSVTPDMLIGAAYRGRTGGDEFDDLNWTFDDTHFRIVAGQQGLPNDLVDTLLPANTSGHRIDGRWSVEGEVLPVSELAVDGKSLDQPPRNLRAICTPVIRIQADKHQYMFARGTAETAWRQGDIPPWSPGTTSVSGSVKFDRKEEGWLSVGYRGLVGERDSIGDGATLNWEPDDSGYGSAQTTTYAPRSCRLQLNGGQPATMRCMGLPPGVYLFYAKWKPTDPQVSEGKIVVEFTRWRLKGRFASEWVVVDQYPVGGLDFDLVATEFGQIEVHVPASGAHQSVFLLPWARPDMAPPPLDAKQAWQIARWAGHQIRVENGSGAFEMVPTGRYRLFLVEHDDPVKDDDTLVEYRVTHDSLATVPKDAVVQVSFRVFQHDRE